MKRKPLYGRIANWHWNVYRLLTRHNQYGIPYKNYAVGLCEMSFLPAVDGMGGSFVFSAEHNIYSRKAIISIFFSAAKKYSAAFCCFFSVLRARQYER